MEQLSLGDNVALYLRNDGIGQITFLGACWFDTGEGAWQIVVPFNEGMLFLDSVEGKAEARQVVEDYVKTGRIPG